jgi:hypothetical protein
MLKSGMTKGEIEEFLREHLNLDRVKLHKDVCRVRSGLCCWEEDYYDTINQKDGEVFYRKYLEDLSKESSKIFNENCDLWDEIFHEILRSL